MTRPRRPVHPFVELARRMTTTESAEYLTSRGWVHATPGSWYSPEVAAYLDGYSKVPPEGGCPSHTLRAALLTAFEREAAAADQTTDTTNEE